MLGCENIVKLYNKVLDRDILQYNIPESAIRIAIRSMAKVYMPTKGKKRHRSVVADFNDVAHRCAYLHKYALLHTALVRDMMFLAIRQNYDFFSGLFFSEPSFKMCSLGGGPGSDVVGVLDSLMDTFDPRHNLDFSVTVIDYMAEWSKSFDSVIKELTSGTYGDFGPIRAGKSLQWRYVGANLLKSYLDPEVEREIASASLITAVKFVSAANCKDTEFMVKNIFSAMKPGAVIFFVDNAGGGFREFILDSAMKFNFIPIYGPIQREDYLNEVVKVKRFGSVSCHRTSVSVAVLQKPYECQPRLCCTVPNAYDISLLPGSGYYRRVDNDCRSSAGYANPIPDTGLASDELKREDERACSQIPNTPLTPYVFKLGDGDAFTPDSSDVADHPAFSPDTPRRGRNRAPTKNGCKSKIKRWRHHLSTKLDSFKSRIRKWKKAKK